MHLDAEEAKKSIHRWLNQRALLPGTRTYLRSKIIGLRAV